MLEDDTAFIENDFTEIQTLLAEGAWSGIYRRYAPVLEDMLSVYTEAEFLDFMEQQDGEIEETPLRLHLAAWQNLCLELGGYEGDVTEKLAAFLKADLPEKLLDKLEHPAVCLDLDEPGGGLEPQLEPYQKQIEPWGCRLKLFFDDTYCAGVYFLFLKAPRAW